MNLLKHTLTLSILLLTSISLQAQDCNAVKDGGTFTYGKNNQITVVIEGTHHTETHPTGTISSTMNWSSECGYSMTIDEVTIPDFPFSTGATLAVVINSVDDNIISYSSTIDGRSWESVMTKIQ